MSLSKQQRQENLELALKQFASNIGSCPIGAYIIVPNDGHYQGIFETTWLDLQRHGYLRPYPKFSGRLLLTGLGLRHGLELCGMHQNKQLQEMLGKISKCLKGFVKGRKQAKGINVETIANETGLQKGFIINVIEAELLERWFKQYGTVWAPGFVGSIIIVPQDFGLPPLS